MKTSNKIVLKRIFKQLKPYRFFIVLKFLFAILSVAGTLVVPVLFGQIINLLDFTKVDTIDYKEIFKLFIIIGAVV